MKLSFIGLNIYNSLTAASFGAVSTRDFELTRLDDFSTCERKQTRNPLSISPFLRLLHAHRTSPDEKRLHAPMDRCLWPLNQAFDLSEDLAPQAKNERIVHRPKINLVHNFRPRNAGEKRRIIKNSTAERKRKREVNGQHVCRFKTSGWFIGNILCMARGSEKVRASRD